MLYLSNILRAYYHEQEAVRGSVSGRQDLGSLSDWPQVWYAVRVDDFLYLEIFVSRRSIFKLCMCVICEWYTAMCRRRSTGAYMDVRTSGSNLTGLRSGGEIASRSRLGTPRFRKSKSSIVRGARALTSSRAYPWSPERPGGDVMAAKGPGEQNP